MRRGREKKGEQRKPKNESYALLTLQSAKEKKVQVKIFFHPREWKNLILK